MPAVNRQYIFTFATPAQLNEPYIPDFELLLHSFQPK
jgi:hypothetical protein